MVSGMPYASPKFYKYKLADLKKKTQPSFIYQLSFFSFGQNQLF
jgi:hypothetical protein